MRLITQEHLFKYKGKYYTRKEHVKHNRITWYNGSLIVINPELIEKLDKGFKLWLSSVPAQVLLKSTIYDTTTIHQPRGLKL